MYDENDAARDARRAARVAGMSRKQLETERFMAAMSRLEAAKAQGDTVLVWGTLDDIATDCMHSEVPSVRVRQEKVLSDHKAQYRTDGCTSDAYAGLDEFWNLPRRASGPAPDL